MQTEIWLNRLHEPLGDGRPRRLTPAELHQCALDLRPGWLAQDLSLSGTDEPRIAHAIATNPDLAAALEPHGLNDDEYGIVLDDNLRARLRTALAREPA